MISKPVRCILLLPFVLAGSSAAAEIPLAQGGFPGRPIEGALECEIVATFANGTKGLERLQGNAAKSHLQNLASRHPGVFSKSSRILEGRGYQRTEDVVVLRHVTLGVRDSIAAPGSLTTNDNSSITSTEGEIVFVSWDDGDPSTWEGSIYMASYAPAGDLLTNVQILLSSDPIEATWEEISYVSPPWTEPENQLMRQGDLDSGTDGASATVESELAVTALNEPPPGPTPTPTPTPSPGGKTPARLWLECVVGGCTLVAIGCWATAPAWPICFSGWCGAVGATCAVTTVLSMIP